MAEKTLLLGIDFGTGGCKVTAIDTGGTVIGEASVEYPTEYAKPGWSEQDPADWYDAMCRALKTLTAKGVALSAVAAVSLDGSTHNAVLLDGNMQVLRKTVMWTDQRSIQECAFLRENYGEKIFGKITGKRSSPRRTRCRLPPGLCPSCAGSVSMNRKC